MQDPLHPQPADIEKPEQQWRAGSLYGAALLHALIADDQPQSLQAWATAAPAVLDAIDEAQAACSSSGGEQTRLCHHFEITTHTEDPLSSSAQLT